jgi:PAS domain S-box-containing protein
MTPFIRTFFLLLAFVATSLYAQFDVDSLQNSSNGKSEANTTQPETVEDYLYLSTKFLKNSPDKALEFSIKAVQEAKTVNKQSLLAKSYKSVGLASQVLRNYPGSLAYYDSALFIYLHSKDSSEMAKIFNNLGIVYSNLGHYVKAIEFYNKSLIIRELKQYSDGLGNVKNNIGWLYYSLNDFEKAAPYFTEAYQYASENNNQSLLLTTLNNMGLILYHDKNYSEAIKKFSECVVLAETLNDIGAKGNAYLNLGNIYVDKKKPDSAFIYLTKALLIFQENNKPLAKTWFGIGKAHRLTNNERQALNAFLKAEEDFAYFPDNSLRIKVLDELYKSWERLGNAAEAFNALKNYHSLFDSMKVFNDSTSVASLQAKFDVDKKINEVAALRTEKVEQSKMIVQQQKENNLNKLLLIFSFIAVFVLLVAVFFYYRIYKKHKKINNLLKRQNRLLEQAKNELATSNAAAAEQEERLLLLINAMPDLICFKDGDGNWRIANQAILSVFGLTHIDYKGKNDLDLIAFSPSKENALRACVVSDEQAWQQGTMTRSDETITDHLGKERVFDTIKIPLFHSNNTRKALIFLGRDVTERKQYELNLSNALSKAEESEKLKSAFLANMSHEIRTPLNAVIGFSELLEADGLNNETIRKYVRHIRENGNTLLGIIGDILELSRIESGAFKINNEAYNLKELFQELHFLFLQLTHQKGKKHLRLITAIPPNDVIISSDRYRLRQVLTNLFDNALKFTQDGFIEYGYKVLNPNSDNPILQIFMKDSGIGIPENKKHLLFKRFTKIHESDGMVYPGTGLGLSIVHQIVFHFGGKVQIESETEKGTTVEISMPVQLAKLPTPTQPTTKKNTVELKGHKVLVVEDVESNFELLKVILETWGMTVLRAIEGQQAIEMCQQTHDLSLVLMDIQLPGINGFDATRAIKKLFPQLPIIAQTAFAMSDEKDACMMAGCDGYIAKPIKAQLLLPVLLEVLYLPPNQFPQT